MNTIAGGDGVAVGISRDNACTPFFYGAQKGRIFRDCPSNGEITPKESESQFITYFYLDPSNNHALFYAAKERMYRTTESSNVISESWDDLGIINSGSKNKNKPEWITKYSANWGTYRASSSYLLIGGDNGSLLRLDDPHNATNLSNAIDITPSGVNKVYPTVVSGIAIHPKNPDIVLVTYSNYGITNIFMTSNATSDFPNWTVVERNLADFSIRSAAITELNGETIYFVGTSRGLYSSPNPITTNWTMESPDQIGFALVSALAYKPSNHKLLIGTHGNGMYEGTIKQLSVKEFYKEETNFTAYPIPASSIINVILENSFEQGSLKYSIFDMGGRKMKNGILNDNKQIFVDQLNSGSYILLLNNNKNKKDAIVFTKK